MALVQISDVYVPEVYASYMNQDGPEKTALFEAGVAIRNPLIDQLFSNGGRVAELPFWNDLDASDEPNYSTDATGDTATPAKIDTHTQVARIANINQAYSAADLASELAGSDPMVRIRQRFSRYWERNLQRRIIASLEGVIADNVDNDSGDMVNDISAATNGAVGSSTKFSRTAFTSAAFTSGDHFDNYTAVAVHSVVYNTMVDNDDIDFIPDSEGRLTIPTFMGRRVIVDDGLPFTAAGGADASDSAPLYTSFLFAEGLIGYGEGPVRTPVEIEREALQGNGGGVETLVERKSWCIHPFGTAFESATLTNNQATLAQLRLAANWDRVVPDRKSLPFAALITNG